MKTENLIEKKQYYFYEKTKNYPIRIRRERFLGVFIHAVNPKYNYLVKSRFEEEIRKTVLIYTPLDWYFRVETLDDILSKTVLPPDVINIIDEFL